MYAIFPHSLIDHCKRVGHSPSGSLATWPSYCYMGVACCARDFTCGVITAAGCLAITYLCQMTLARISVPPDLNWPTWSHSLTRLCRHHIGSTRVAARWTIRLTYIAAALQLPEELTLLRDSFGRYCWSGSPRVLEVDRQQEKLSHCKAPSSQTSIRGSGGHPSVLNYTRHWHCVRAVKQTFHRRFRRRHHRRRRWIRWAAVAQRSAAGICAACL